LFVSITDSLIIIVILINNNSKQNNNSTCSLIIMIVHLFSTSTMIFLYSFKIAIFTLLSAIIIICMYATARIQPGLNKHRINKQVMRFLLAACIMRIGPQIIRILELKHLVANGDVEIIFYMISNSFMVGACCALVFFWVEIVKTFFSNTPKINPNISKPTRRIKALFHVLVLFTFAGCATTVFYISTGRSCKRLYNNYFAGLVVIAIYGFCMMVIFGRKMLQNLEKNTMQSKYAPQLSKLIFMMEITTSQIFAVNIVGITLDNFGHSLFQQLVEAFLSFVFEAALIITIINYLSFKKLKFFLQTQLGSTSLDSFGVCNA